VCRDRGQDPLGQVSVRVEQRQALAGGHVLPNECFEHRGFAGTRLPDHAQVRPAIGPPDAE